MIKTVNGISMHVTVTGEGEPLLLLHGFTGSGSSWDAFIPSWSERFQVIAVDLLGHGLTESPADAKRYSMEHAVSDLAVLLDELDIPRVNLLGYSMGGRLALSFAIQEQARVSRLILESSSPGLSSEQARAERIHSDEQLADRIEREGIEWFADYWGNIPLFQSLKRLPEAVQQSIYQQRLLNAPLGLANSLRGMGTGVQPSLWDKLVTLKLPVQLIAGELDTKFVLIAEQMQSSISGSKFAKVAQAGHIVHTEQPELFDKIVLQFLSK